MTSEGVTAPTVDASGYQSIRLVLRGRQVFKGTPSVAPDGVLTLIGAALPPVARRDHLIYIATGEGIARLTLGQEQQQFAAVVRVHC